MTKSCKLIGWIALIALSVLSCKKNGSEATPGQPDPVPVAHGKPQGTPVSKSIGPAGGTLQTADGNISLEIPAGAVTTATNFTIQPVSHTLESATGTAYRLSPESVDFKKDVKITFKYTDENLSGTTENDLYLAYQDAEGYWRRSIMTNIDKAGKKLSVLTRHFSDWTIERLFWIHNISNKTSMRAGENTGFIVYFSDMLNGKKALSSAMVPIPNIETWFVTGPGTFNFPKSNAVQYTAPASIMEQKEVAIGVRIKNMVSQRHPDRAGNSGLAIVQIPMDLMPDEYFTWEMDGTKHVSVALDAALLGTTTNIMGTGLTGGISLFVNAIKPGSYEMGSAAAPDMFNAQVSVSGGTTVIYLGTYYNCNEGTPRYGKGKVTIMDYGSIGGIISGYFTATVYTPVDNCQNKSKLVTGSFYIRRKS